MKFWISKGAFILGVSVFFVILILNLAGFDPFNPEHLIPAIFKAIFGGALFWFTGFILGDIVLKGVLADFDTEDKNNLLEGGLVQRIHTEKERFVPGGPELPFTETKVTYQRVDKKESK